MGACETAIEWGKQYGTIEEAWQVCERGDWMLWLVGKLSGKPETDSRKKLVLVACECTRLALPFVKKGELRPLNAIETAEAYLRGDGSVTLADVRRAAAYAAHAAPRRAAAYAAACATCAAAHAAAYAAACATPRRDILKQCAKIVRKYYPQPPQA